MINEIAIEARTISGIIDELEVDDVNFLMVDAEGYDATIVRSFPFQKIHPSLVIFEGKHISEDELDITKTLLGKAGYHWLPMQDWENNIFAISNQIMSEDEFGLLNEIIANRRQN
jgi:hypothetical protein